MLIERRFQGIEGMAQGGHLAGMVTALQGPDLGVVFRAPCPLDTELVLDGSRLLAGDTVILETVPAAGTPAPPPFVDPAAAMRARRRAEGETHIQAVSTCFSCGTGPGSFRVHAGPVEGSDLYASPLTHPEWAGRDGVVEHRFLWAPIDCAAGWRVSIGDGGRPAVTGRLEVSVHIDVAPGTPLVVVADADPEWDGRKRSARSAIYTADGALVASSGSVWVALA